MTLGYMGKILRLDLTTKASSVIDTEPYTAFGGGRGMGTAVFWDECEDYAASSFSPKNVLCIMTSPLTGALFANGARIDMTGIQSYSYPTEYFTGSNSGGHFGSMLKQAGWDGIVIKGSSDTPVWINIINDKVTFEDASSLWGQDTWATSIEIRSRVTGSPNFGEWQTLDDGSQTTQRPEVIAIGQAGETLSRFATVQVGTSGGFSQGGFGGVWGAKNLKAISVLGTKSVKIADPITLYKAKCKFYEKSPKIGLPPLYLRNQPGRYSACSGCSFPCKARRFDGNLNDAQCTGGLRTWGLKNYPGVKHFVDLQAMYGLNAFEVCFSAVDYIKALYDLGVIGPGKEIDTAPLPMDKFGTVLYYEAYFRAIATREGIGKYIAEGTARLAEALGRYEQDTTSGILAKPQWGYEAHNTIPDTTFAYGSLLGSRDCDEHCFHSLYRSVSRSPFGREKMPADKLVNILSQATAPYQDDPYMFDCSPNYETGQYSKHRAKLIAWHRHYTRYYKQSMGFCDWVWPQFVNGNEPDLKGLTPEMEPVFINAITGNNMTFADGIEIGRKIWNLKRSIIVMEGRHRDIENFTGYAYTPNILTHGTSAMSPTLGNTVYKNGKWDYDEMSDFYFNKDGVEAFKTHYYRFEGWDIDTGWPTRNTLEELGLKKVADKLESAGKLGKPN